MRQKQAVDGLPASNQSSGRGGALLDEAGPDNNMSSNPADGPSGEIIEDEDCRLADNNDMRQVHDILDTAEAGEGARSFSADNPPSSYVSLSACGRVQDAVRFAYLPDWWEHALQLIADVVKNFPSKMQGARSLLPLG